MKEKTSTYTVRLQVIFNRVSRMYTANYHLSEEDSNKLRAPRINEKSQEIKDKLQILKRDTEEFLHQMDAFSFYEFEGDFINTQKWLKTKKNLVPPVAETIIDGFDYSPLPEKV